MQLALAHRVHLRSGNLSNLVMHLRSSQKLLYLFLRHFCRNDNALQYAVVTNLTRNRTGVHAYERRDILLLKEGLQSLLIAPVARAIAELADNEALEEAFFALGEQRVAAIVAYQRIGHNYDLAAEGRISQGFLIAAHAGGENNLAYSIAFAAIQSAFINTAVF